MIEGGYSPEATDYFIKGNPVQIKDGPLKGIKGEVVEVNKKNHLIIKVDAIQHSISIKIDRAYLSKL